MKTRYSLFCWLPLLAVCSALGQETNLLSKLEAVPLFPDLRADASTNAIPVDRIAPAPGMNPLAAGDSLTALITLHQKGNRRTQWLVYFQVVPTTNRPAQPARPEVLYNSTGDKFEFSNSPATFRIRTLGPYVETSSFWGKPVAKDESASTSVNATFLGLGLEKGAAVMQRLNLAHATNFNFWVADKPPSHRELERNQKLAVECKITPEEKRSLASWMPTLMSYFTAVGETPGLESIMWKVISLPSMWSIVRHVGVTASMSMDMDNVGPLSLPAGWKVPGGSQVFALPFQVEFNRQRALNATLFVTDPHPSLLACGGIMGFAAMNPGDDDIYLTLRVISTRWGAEEKKEK